jgi:hypothetical protein
MKLMLLFAMCFAIASIAFAQTTLKKPTGKPGTKNLETTKKPETTKQPETTKKAKSKETTKNLQKESVKKADTKESTKKPEPTKSQQKKPTLKETMKKNEMTFNEFKEKFNKTYTSKDVEAEAEKNFKATKAKVDKHNSDSETKYMQGINAMADISTEKFKKTRLGMRGANSTKMLKNFKKSKNVHESLGKFFNATLKKAMEETLDLRR